MTRSPHDSLFKASFESPLHAAALFRQVLLPELVDAIDWQTIQREAGSFIDPERALLIDAATEHHAQYRPPSARICRTSGSD